MAITPTGAIFKTLTFDGVQSDTYGVYISGEAVFNAPTRDVNMITIPGRNGLFAQDNGRFDNITVTYPAGLFGATEGDFRAGIESLRDVFCSRVGYKKLTDDYNPNEFRMAVYKSGLEVTPETLRAGTFDLTFECKPQRFLTSGDTKTAISNGGNLTNPTPYDAYPLLEFTGNGYITMTNHVTSEAENISVASIPIGYIELGAAQNWTRTPGNAVSVTKTIDVTLLNTSDAINLESVVVKYDVGGNSGTPTSISASGDATGYISGTSFCYDFGALGFAKGTSTTKSATGTNAWTRGTAKTQNVSISVAYNGSTSITVTATAGSSPDAAVRVQMGAVSGYSTKTNSGTTYVDCETGLCWQNIGGELTSANNAVTLPANLPKLWASQQVDFTIYGLSNVKITPRWWRV